MPRTPPPSPPARRSPTGKGIARAIYAVTGVVDEVNDLIVPGAFARTLATRRVKTVWHHDWKDPVGTVLDVEEWKPGDPRFATIPGGSMWPAAAGALVATVQYNLRTIRGRDAYEQVDQWHKNNEAAFSIGYKVVPGGAAKRHDGVRVIHDLELYEISPVLHGAHPMTRSIEVKAAARTGDDDLERKATWSTVELKAAETQTGRGVMVALRLPPDVAAKIAHPEGTPAEHLHITLAYLGDAAALSEIPDDLHGIVAPSVAGTAPLKGTIGGIGRFPDTGDGEPTWVPVDVPGLAELRQRVVEALGASAYADKLNTQHGYTPHVTLGYALPEVAPVPATPVTFDQVAIVRGADTSFVPLGQPAAPAPSAEEPADDTAAPSAAVPPAEVKSAAQIVLEAKGAGPDAHRGDAEQLRKWYAHGEGAARIGWGARGDFDRCVAIAAQHMSPDDAKGYCNLRHHDALGIYPATHAAAERKSAAQVVLEAKSHPLPKAEPMSPISPMPLSYEQLHARIAEAARNLLTEDGDDCYVAVEATYPDHVIVTRYSPGDSSTYSIPYTAAGRDIDLGTPSQVELTTVALPVTGESHAVDGDEEITARYMQPTAAALQDATALIEVSDAGPEHLQHLKPTITDLLTTLAKKGLPMSKQTTAPSGSSLDLWDSEYDVTDGWDDDTDDTDAAEDAEGTEGAATEDTSTPTAADGSTAADSNVPAATPDDTGPVPAAQEPDTDDEDEDDEQVRLNADEVKAVLAALSL
ncbi:2'-5' RNA ligase family protein [Streptomyces rimosus]|uniref:2'-5' RNA ligase family protein n=1 Tax=Streptomyces rimosus TaxID=1927 RepID=UPI000AFE61CC|nr:2'-5' RNA ligase family protein [Streptomyces rimosus]